KHMSSRKMEPSYVKSLATIGMMGSMPVSKWLNSIAAGGWLYVNCFQPSMKLVVSDGMGGSIARHDPAKTPLQRVLLSGILAAERERGGWARARAIDRVRLLGQVEKLQQAVFHCAVGVTPFPHRQPATPVLRFREHLCQTESCSQNQGSPIEGGTTPLEPPES